MDEDQDLSPMVGPKIKRLYEDYCQKIKVNAKEKLSNSMVVRQKNSMNLMQIEMEKERDHLQNLELNSSNDESIDAREIQSFEKKLQLKAPIFVINKMGKINKNAKNKTLQKD